MEPGMSFTTRHALQEAMLTPRFYTTDFDQIDRLNIEHLRDEFDWIRNEFARDYNRNHFVRNEEFLANFDDMPERETFIEFLERSCTAEFSGCLLYAEMVKHLKDPTLRAIFQYMSRDEGRHVAFGIQFIADLTAGQLAHRDTVIATFERHLPRVLDTVGAFHEYDHPIVDVAALQEYALGAYRQFMAAAAGGEGEVGELAAEVRGA